MTSPNRVGHRNIVKRYINHLHTGKYHIAYSEQRETIHPKTVRIQHNLSVSHQLRGCDAVACRLGALKLHCNARIF